MSGAEKAIEAGAAVLDGRGNGTYEEAEEAIRQLIKALSLATMGFGSSDEARAISNGIQNLPASEVQP